MYRNIYIERNRIVYKSLREIQNREKGHISILCFPTFQKDFGISFYKMKSHSGWIKNTILKVTEDEFSKDSFKISLYIKRETGILQKTVFEEIESKIKNTPFPKSQVFGEGGRDGTVYELNLNSAIKITLNWWSANLDKNSDWEAINQTVSEIVEQVKDLEAEESKEFLYIYEENTYTDNVTGGSRLMTHTEIKPQ